MTGLELNLGGAYTAAKVFERADATSSAPRLIRGIFAPTFSCGAALGRRASGLRRVAVAIQDPQGKSDRLTCSSVQPPGTPLPLNKARGELNKSTRRTDMSAQALRASVSDADLISRLRAIPGSDHLINALLGEGLEVVVQLPAPSYDFGMIRLDEVRALLSLLLEPLLEGVKPDAAQLLPALQVADRLLAEARAGFSSKGV